MKNRTKPNENGKISGLFCFSKKDGMGLDLAKVF
tara:strand:+ start:451 stop:552 length:102 start_codon:yes stop_codon:yes gene_type:complete